ncbi:MAG: recombinase RecA [Thermoplasmata archaeon]|nr:recombinase RecA [Candidatus Sysuiplasma acidicola]
MNGDDRTTQQMKCRLCGGNLDDEDRCVICGQLSMNDSNSNGDDGSASMDNPDDMDFDATEQFGPQEESSPELNSIVKWLSNNDDEFTSPFAETVEYEIQEEAVSEGEGRQQATEPGPREPSATEEELRRKLAEAEAKISRLTSEVKAIESVTVMGAGEAERKVTELVKLQVELEAKLKDREKAIDDYRNELRFKDERMKEFEAKLKFKEEEFNKHEVDLQHREEIIKEELRQIEMKKQQLGSVKEIELKKSLESLQEQISQKEEKLRAAEKYLAQKESDMKQRENALIGKEIVAFEEMAVAELKQDKVKTGTSRLDDLLLGGIPAGSQVIIYGPSFVGKEVAMNAFAAEGLKKGVPLIWVTTDKTIPEIREEMKNVLNGYEEYEKLGLVFYVDAYSRGIGDTTTLENTAYLENSSDLETINTLVEQRVQSLHDIVEKKSYRLVFRSISSLSASYDIRSIFRLLRPFVAKRKRDKCVAMYSIEKGIIGDQDAQIISSVMDGVMEFMTDGQSNFLSIQGICETQTRDKIKYTASKRSLVIGSFTLGHIK